MSRRLSANVTVDGTLYRPGTVPPADVARKISNEAAWEPADVEADEPVPAEPKARRRQGRAANRAPSTSSDDQGAGAGESGDASPAGQAESEGASGDATGGSASTDPPAGNASTADWAAFAATVGVTVPEDAKREDIKGVLTERGLLDAGQ